MTKGERDGIRDLCQDNREAIAARAGTLATALAAVATRAFIAEREVKRLRRGLKKRGGE
jgi:hypothetical protein